MSADAAVEASGLSKFFGEKAAVSDLSFTVAAGEIFGLIGPNGAGKTTTIRMMMGILAPDAGAVKVLGRTASRENRLSVGYLPEERGLYRKLSVIDCVLYIASLIGVERGAAERRADELLELTGLLPRKGDRIEALSKGLAQLAQFVVSIIHDPVLVILDEPLAGLDPVNKELLMGILLDLKRRGRTVILSTHQMSDVEELCDRILMVDEGRAVLYGSLGEIRSRFACDRVLVAADGDVPDLPGIAARKQRGERLELTLEPGTSPQQVLASIVARGNAVRYFEAAAPSLHEIFLQVADHA